MTDTKIFVNIDGDLSVSIERITFDEKFSIIKSESLDANGQWIDESLTAGREGIKLPPLVSYNIFHRSKAWDLPYFEKELCPEIGTRDDHAAH